MMENLRVIWQKAAIALLVSVVVNLLYNLILATIRSIRATNKITRKPFVPQRFLTLRISNIPRGENTKTSLREILSDLPIEAQGIGGQPHLLGYSYAPTAVASFAAKYAVATATFEHAPALSELEMVLKQKLGDKDNHLKVDQDFLGMTPLHNSDDIDVDIIAVTGLAGHAFGSWKSKNKPHMWLRDFLPQSIKNARILTYGYDTKIYGSQSETTILELAKTLLESIKTTRGKDIRNRPLIFIAHSLGGLLVKQALVQASGGNEEDKAVYRSCYALLFFGVPNRGLNNLSLMSMVKGQANESLVRDLGESSRFLSQLHDNFNACFTFNDSHVLSINETRRTPTVEWSSQTGALERSGPAQMMVGHTSATNAHQKERIYDRIAMDVNHSELVKFSDLSSQNYSIVQDRIINLVDNAPRVIRNRLDKHKRKMTQLETQFLRNLKAPNYQAFRNDKVNDRTPGTLDWFLDNALYQSWKTSNSASCLWIQGSPGQGKTVLAKFILEKLEVSLNYDPLSPVIYFFFYDQDDSYGTAGAAMRSFIKQLLLVAPDAFEIISETSQPFDIESSISDSLLRDILKGLLESSHFKTIYCVIDGLDECQNDESRRLLLQLITKIVQSPSTRIKTSVPTIKILLTSRPTIDLHAGLRCLPSIHLKANPNDLMAFITDKVQDLDFRKELKEYAINLLGRRVEQTFLWISIVLKRLKAATPLMSRTIMKQIIDESPLELKNLFESIIKQIKKREDTAAQKLLIWVAYGRRPLELKELEEAVAIQDDSTSKESISNDSINLTEGMITSAAGVILEVIDGKLHLIHQSAKDFLLSSEYLAEFEFCMSLHPSSYLAKVCMTYLCFTDFVESGPCRNDELLSQRHIQYPFLRYAARYWYRHLQSKDDYLELKVDIKKLSGIISQLTIPKSPTLLAWGEAAGIPNLEEAKDTWDVAVKTNIKWLVKLQINCTLITEEVIEKAVADGDTGYDTLQLLVTGKDIRFTEKALCIAAKHLDHALLQQLLSKQDKAIITQNVFEAAASNVEYGRLVIKMILESKKRLKVTARFISLAQKNKKNGKGIIESIIKNDELEIPADAVRQIIAGRDTTIAKLLLNTREQLDGIQLGLVSAVGNMDYEMMMLLLDQGRNETVITEEIIIRIAKIQEEKREERKHLLLFILQERSQDFPISEEVLKAIAHTEGAENEVLQLLFKEKDHEIDITDAIWKEAAGNIYSNGQTISLLLSMRSHEFCIHQEILRSAARNPLCGYQIMRHFLETKGYDIRVAELIVKETLKSYISKEEMASLLSQAQRRGVLLNTEDIVKAAAGTQGASAMDALFETSSHEIRITEEILKEVVRSSFDGRIMQFLFESKGDEIQITEQVLIEAARSSYGYKVLHVIFDRIGYKIQITEEILKEAAKNKLSGEELIRFISAQQGDEIRITEGILIEAARNRTNWGVILFLLETFGDKIEMTGEILKAAIRKKSNLQILSIISEYKGSEVRITDEIKELMSEEQLECWARPEKYLPPWLRSANKDDE